MANIIVDSGCDLTPEMKKEHGIQVVPLTMQLDDHLYVDDGTLDVSAYIDAMNASKDMPKSAAPSPDSFFEKFKAEGSMFAVTLSSQLSGSYNSAMLAKQMYLEEVGQKFIHIFDSLSASVGETVIVMKLHEAIKNNLSDNEIVAQVNGFIKQMHTYYILERYDTLVKTGRMNPYVAKLASLMSFKAICGAKDGHTIFLDKARGYQKAVQKMLDIVARENDGFENRVLAITHVKALERAMELKEAFTSRFNFKSVVITEASGLVATYANMHGVIVSL